MDWWGKNINVALSQIRTLLIYGQCQAQIRGDRVYIYIKTISQLI